jgi:hypothetical protein
MNRFHPPGTLMDLTVQNVLHWLIVGVVAIVALSLLGVLINIATALLGFVLRVGVVVLLVLLVLRFFEGRRT